MKKRKLRKTAMRLLALCLAVSVACTTPALAVETYRMQPTASLQQTDSLSSEDTVTVVDDNDPSIQYSGWNLWTEGDDYTQHYSTTVGATITYTFYGTGIELFCDKVSNGPIVSVSIDGVVEDADQYAPSKQQDVPFYSKQGLAQEEHTLVITLTDRSNPNSAPIGGGSLQATLTHLEVTNDPVAGELPPMPEEKTVTKVEDTDSGIQYSSDWQLWTEGDSYTQHYCRTPGATFTYSFVGTGIELFCDIK